MLASRVRMATFKDSSSIPSGYVLASDDDFSGKVDGGFNYIGTDEYVEMPHVIKGVPVTRYYNMFKNTSVKGVVSTNKNVVNLNSMFRDSKVTSLDLSNFDTSSVTNMYSMFQESQATSLDLSSFDTSNVTETRLMFYLAKATTGYARTQADADKFNASSNKPVGLTFIVKP